VTAVEVSEVFRNWGIVAAGLVGLAIAVWRAVAADRQSKAQMDQVTQAHREHVAKLFGEAVQQLDDEKLHVRLGAIFMLREITEVFPELSRPALDLLTSYLQAVEYGDDEPPTDVQAIMETILPIERKDT